MLTIHGGDCSQFCDGRSRRNFLRIGGLAAAGLTLPQWLQAQASKRSGKSIIMICLGGGPSHIDMYDMRPEAPVEYRGEFRPVASRVPGMEMCDLMPRSSSGASLPARRGSTKPAAAITGPRPATP